MRKYRLNKQKFVDFVCGTLSIVVLACLFVWVTYEWVMAL